MAYLPIDQYGLIGDMHTVALVAVNGSIDWMCMPRFDSPSLFCAILDDQKGGFFRIAPIHEDDIAYKQFYWPATNVLVTRFLSKQGAAELIDFMAVDERRGERRRLIRRITALRGRIEIRVECRPAFNFARDRHETAIVETRRRVPQPGPARRPRDQDAAAGRRRRRGRRVCLVARRQRELRAARAGHRRKLRRAPVGGRRRSRLSRHRGVLAPLGLAMHLPRPLARDRQPLRPGAQAFDLRADRRDRRRPDLLAPRGHRRRAQLGLSLHLGARFGVHRLCVPAPGLHRGGQALLQVHLRGLRVAVGRRRCRSCTASTASRS